MDENVKNDAKQVMLVQNADDGRLQAVTGVDRDGNIQTADPTDQNVASSRVALTASRVTGSSDRVYRFPPK